MTALEDRVRSLEGQLAGVKRHLGAQATVSGTVLRPEGHEPEAGTWDAEQRTAVCKFCGDPITGGTDSHHGWASQREGATCGEHTRLEAADRQERMAGTR